MSITQLILLVVGGVLVYFAYKTSIKECPPVAIEYRFIPRTFKEEQESPIPPSDIFKNMFENPTPRFQ